MSNPKRSTSTNYIYYLALLTFFGLGIWLILATGAKLNSVKLPRNDPPQSVSNQLEVKATTNGSSNRSPLSILLLQLIVIIIVAKLFAFLFRLINQPPVMGEMLAGIVLRPSLLGLLFPQISSFLFPPTSMTTLGVFSQIGVVLFMFVVGSNLTFNISKKELRPQ